MAKSKHQLIVNKAGVYLYAQLVSSTIPADAVGPSYKTHSYYLSDGTEIMYGLSKSRALKMLLEVATERDWIVMRCLN